MASQRTIVILSGIMLFLAGMVVGKGGLTARRAPEVVPVDYETLYGQAMTLALVRKVIRDRFVDEVSDEKIFQGAVRGMVGSLDPYSGYLTPDQYRELKTESGGEFEGIGIVVTTRSGWLEVLTPITGSPAARAGLRPGDRILEINNRSARDVSLEDAAVLLRGRPGTLVQLRILHVDEPDPVLVTIVRERITAPSVTSRSLDGGFGYIRLSAFHENSPDELDRQARDLIKGGARGLVVDLRNNGGGLLGSGIRTCDLFLEDGDIVSTKGRDVRENQSWSARKKGTLPAMPVVVLINGGTASAAEILAGALQDHGRARVVGEASFGKGTVQTIVAMSDGAALKLTTARYLTPRGRSFSHTADGLGGITPDVAVELTPAARRAVFQGLAQGNVDGGTDPQLARALEELKTMIK